MNRKDCDSLVALFGFLGRIPPLVVEEREELLNFPYGPVVPVAAVVAMVVMWV